MEIRQFIVYLMEEVAAGRIKGTDRICAERHGEICDVEGVDTVSAGLVRIATGVEFYSTLIYRRCMYCRETIGTKNGQGETGITSTACPPCRDEVIAAMMPFEMAVRASA